MPNMCPKSAIVLLMMLVNELLYLTHRRYLFFSWFVLSAAKNTFSIFGAMYTEYSFPISDQYLLFYLPGKLSSVPIISFKRDIAHF